MCGGTSAPEGTARSDVSRRSGLADLIQGIWGLILLVGVGYLAWNYILPNYFPRTTATTVEAVEGSSESPLANVSVSTNDVGELGTLVIVKGHIRNNFSTRDYTCYASDFLLIGESSIEPDLSVSGCGSSTVAPGTSTNFTMAFVANTKDTYKLRVQTNYNQYVTIPIDPASQ